MIGACDGCDGYEGFSTSFIFNILISKSHMEKYRKKGYIRHIRHTCRIHTRQSEGKKHLCGGEAI